MSIPSAAAQFQARYHARPRCVVRAPGRVNLIGDHTDYSGGLVLPIAIEQALYVAAGPSANGHSEAYSDWLGDTVRWSDGSPSAVAQLPRWARYVAGVSALLRASGVELPEAALWIGGDLPSEAGLSSSAALEVGAGLALLALAKHDMPRLDLAELCRSAENEYAGSPCGVMDQLCCACAEAGCALLIDCDQLHTRAVRLPAEGVCVVVIDTGVRHSVAGEEYGTRRREVVRALEIISRSKPDVTSLRALTLPKVAACSEQLGAILAKRVTHVVTENDRVQSAVEALEAGDLQRVGTLMSESHASLRDDYEVSCPESDDVVAVVGKVPGVYGARMTGGGFGGCVVALADPAALEEMEAALRRNYDDSHPTPATMFTVQAAAAAEVVMQPG